MDIAALLMEKAKAFPDLVIKYAPGIVLALLIFFIGRAIVRRLSGATVKGTQKIPNFDETLAKFCGSIVLFFGTLAVIVASLAAMNIGVGWLITIISALVVALGFALKDTLGDFASGVMLAFFRPFQVGDEVELAGEKGVVQDLGIFSTTMKTRDNIQINVGNGTAFNSTIKNFYAFGDRRLDMDFGVSYNADLDKAIAAIISAADGDERIRDNPAPWAKVTTLGDSAVIIQLRVWCHADEHRNVQMDMSDRVKTALDKAGIDIPYEHCMIIPVEA
jgi:small conductance mechanosensitive channel